MAKFYSFPHYEINIKDESMRTPLIVEKLPLHRPIFFVIGEKGRVGYPVFGGYDKQKKEFGEATFDVFSKFFKHQNVFLNKALQFQEVFVVRVADNTIAVSNLVLECSVQTRSDIPVWQTDTNGIRLTDTNGDWIQELDTSNNPVVSAGVVVNWTVRTLATNEDPNNITTVVTPDVNGDITKYPVAVFRVNSPGSYGNNIGVKLWWDSSAVPSLAEDLESIVYKIAFVEIPYGFDTPQPIYNKYLYRDTDFTFKEATVDPSTKRRYNLSEVLEKEYVDSPIVLKLYADNVTAICNTCLANLDTVLYPEVDGKPHMVNIINGKAIDGTTYYRNIVVGGPTTDHTQSTPYTNSITNKNIIQYLRDGQDGDISDTNYENLVKEYLTGSVFPDILDKPRFPITHLYDSGFTTDVKEKMIDFLGVRDDVKVIMSTQSIYDEANNKSEDNSLGSFLRSRLLLHPESYIYGTQAIRGTIIQQAGYLTDGSGYVKLVPATIDNLIKRCTYQGATYIKGKPKGLPRSAVTILNKINWFPVQDDFKQLSWDNSLNYMQYYDMTGYHYPDVISVYPYKTSLLSDDVFVDLLIYIKHIARFQWAKFSGIDDPIGKLIGDIRESVQRDIYSKMGNYIRTEVNPYQTELDAELGYALTVEIAAYGTVPNRVWNVIVPVRREYV
jgi:hypothetical protein